MALFPADFDIENVPPPPNPATAVGRGLRPLELPAKHKRLCLKTYAPAQRSPLGQLPIQGGLEPASPIHWEASRPVSASMQSTTQDEILSFVAESFIEDSRECRSPVEPVSTTIGPVVDNVMLSKMNDRLNKLEKKARTLQTTEHCVRQHSTQLKEIAEQIQNVVVDVKLLKYSADSEASTQPISPLTAPSTPERNKRSLVESKTTAEPIASPAVPAVRNRLAREQAVKRYSLGAVPSHVGLFAPWLGEKELSDVYGDVRYSPGIDTPSSRPNASDASGSVDDKLDVPVDKNDKRESVVVDRMEMIDTIKLQVENMETEHQAELSKIREESDRKLESYRRELADTVMTLKAEGERRQQEYETATQRRLGELDAYDLSLEQKVDEMGVKMRRQDDVMGEVKSDLIRFGKVFDEEEFRRHNIMSRLAEVEGKLDKPFEQPGAVQIPPDSDTHLIYLEEIKTERDKALWELKNAKVTIHLLELENARLRHGRERRKGSGEAKRKVDAAPVVKEEFEDAKDDKVVEKTIVDNARLMPRTPARPAPRLPAVAAMTPFVFHYKP